MFIELDKVSVTFGQRKVLDSIAARFESGRTSALVGPSGSGKSTLLGVIAGLIKPDKGYVQYSTGERPELEWAVQSIPLLGRRTVLDNILLSAGVRGRNLDEAMKRAARAMASVGIDRMSDTKAFKLSGGEKQRVAIARAITVEAPVILADEPTASLDATSRDLVTKALRMAAENGAIVVIATHDSSVSERCDVKIGLESVHRAEAFT